MMKISTLISPIYLFALFATSTPVSATTLQVDYTNNNASMALFQQSTTSGQYGDTENSGAEPKEKLDKVELEKKCAMARKNIDILKSSKGTKTFKTSEGELVMYSSGEIKQMIGDNESVLKDECQ